MLVENYKHFFTAYKNYFLQLNVAYYYIFDSICYRKNRYDYFYYTDKMHQMDVFLIDLYQIENFYLHRNLITR